MKCYLNKINICPYRTCPATQEMICYKTKQEFEEDELDRQIALEYHLKQENWFGESIGLEGLFNES